jgi:hypothetical protein
MFLDDFAADVVLDGFGYGTLGALDSIRQAVDGFDPRSP